MSFALKAFKFKKMRILMIWNIFTCPLNPDLQFEGLLQKLQIILSLPTSLAFLLLREYRRDIKQPTLL